MIRFHVCFAAVIISLDLSFVPQATTPSYARSTRGTASAYAALGASETYGVGAVPVTRGFAYLVGRGLHARRAAIVGISGATLHDAYSSELKRALAVRPALCTVFFGFNDLVQGVTLASFRRELKSLLRALRQAGARVLVIGLPDLSRLSAVRAAGIPNVNAILSGWNAGMRSTASRNGAYFLDLAASRYSVELASHPGYISPDGLHPSNVGHARLAAVVLADIRALHLWT